MFDAQAGCCQAHRNSRCVGTSETANSEYKWWQRWELHDGLLVKRGDKTSAFLICRVIQPDNYQA